MIYPDHLPASAGLRHFTYDNTLQGFYGFSRNFSSTYRRRNLLHAPLCLFTGRRAPILNREPPARVTRPKFNLTYRFDQRSPDLCHLFEGLPPGRRQSQRRRHDSALPAGLSEKLEIGLENHVVRQPLALQWRFLPRRLVEFPIFLPRAEFAHHHYQRGTGEIEGLETDLEFAATQNLTLTGGFSLLDAKLTQTFCGDPTYRARAPGFDPSTRAVAASGTRLPVTPKFKGKSPDVIPSRSALQRQRPGLGGLCRRAHRRFANCAANAFGDEPAYTVADFSAGVEMNELALQIYVSNAFDKRAVLEPIRGMRRLAYAARSPIRCAESAAHHRREIRAEVLSSRYAIRCARVLLERGGRFVLLEKLHHDALPYQERRVIG